MILELQSKNFDFRYPLTHGRWTLKYLHSEEIWVETAPISLDWHTSKRRGIWLSNREPLTHQVSNPHPTRFGVSSNASLTWGEKTEPFNVHLEFELLQEIPLIRWRLSIRNISNEPIFLDRFTLLHAGSPREASWHSGIPITHLGGRSKTRSHGGLSISSSNADLAFFTNGWQSWNYAGALAEGDHFPRTKLGFLAKPMRLVRGTPRTRKRGHFHSDMFAVLGDRKTRKGWITGFLSQQHSFGLIEGWVGLGSPALRMWSELGGVRLGPNQEFRTDWAALELLDIDNGLVDSHYVKSVALENDVALRHPSQTGWCSWYHVFQDVTQEHLQTNASWLGEKRDVLPLDLLQLDDGYQKEIGDWFDFKDSFPNELDGPKALIVESDLEAGVWCAPFLAGRKSLIARGNKDWILRNRAGLPVNPGFLWNSFPYVLDVSHPEVLDHVKKIIDTYVNQYGFEYLKLDFLYAGALEGVRFNPELTGAQALSNMLQLIRDVAGDHTKLLGCGCPIGSGIGIFDFMRINPDVAPHWLPQFEGIQIIINKEEGLPGTRNALLTAINRSFMHNRWWVNDPDCLLVRDENSDLSANEVQTLATVITLSAGSIIASDHLPDLSSERLEWLAKTLPPLPRSAQVLDWFDTPTPSSMLLPLRNQTGSWFLLAQINWEDQPADQSFNLGDIPAPENEKYHVVDFWGSTYQRVESTTFQAKQVPAHGVRFVSIRADSGRSQWLGSTLHTSQGLFVRQFEEQDQSLSAEIDLGRVGSGEVWLKVPAMPSSISFNRELVAWEMITEEVVQIRLDKVRSGRLVVSWDRN